MSRRAFLRRGMVAGLAVAVPGALLAACSSDAAAFAPGTTSVTGSAALASAAVAPPTSRPSSTTTTTTTTLPAGPALFPNGMELLVAFSYRAAGGGLVRNPYIAVWVEDPAEELVATIALWFEQSQGGLQHLGGLRRWLTVDGTWATVNTISGATRRPGDYVVAWNGLGLDGVPVAQGTYRLAIESAREHGPYSLIREEITIGSEPFAQPLATKGELSDATVSLASA